MKQAVQILNIDCKPNYIKLTKGPFTRANFSQANSLTFQSVFAIHDFALYVWCVVNVQVIVLKQCFSLQHVKSSIASQWNRSYRDQLLLDYDSTLLHDLNDYTKYCTQFAWCAVTQVPPLKIDFRTAAYSSRSHTVSQAFSFTEERSPTRRPVRSESRTVFCYLWPTLQDCDGKVIRKGEVILKN